MRIPHLLPQLHISSPIRKHPPALLKLLKPLKWPTLDKVAVCSSTHAGARGDKVTQARYIDRVDDEPEEGPLFEIEGPDEDGCVWICSSEGRDVWCRNLGPADKVAEMLSQWLGSRLEQLH